MKALTRQGFPGCTGRGDLRLSVCAHGGAISSLGADSSGRQRQDVGRCLSGSHAKPPLRVGGFHKLR